MVWKVPANLAETYSPIHAARRQLVELDKKYQDALGLLERLRWEPISFALRDEIDAMLACHAGGTTDGGSPSEEGGGE